MGTPKQQVDAYLGDGWYDDWQQMNDRASDASHQFFKNRVRLHLDHSSPIVERIDDDFDVLERIAGDYARGMTLVAIGRHPDKTKLDQIFSLYTLAIVIVENENEMLKAMFETGLAAAWIMLPIVLLQAQAQRMLDVLEDLKKELKKAEHEVGNARHKRAFHLAVAFAEAMFPEISLGARVGIFLSDVVMDKALGPPDPSTSQRYAGIVTPGVKQFSEAVHHIPEYSHEAHAVAENMGKVATVATFYFDYEEISEGEERAEKLRELTEKVKADYDSLVKVIQDNRVAIQKFVGSFDRWTRAIEDVRRDTDRCRARLSDDMNEFGYSLAKMVAWPDAA